MQSTFTLTKDELNMDFLKGLKKIFTGDILNISVSDNSSAAEDETEYLLSNSANKKFLLESIKQGKEGKITTFNVEDL